MGDGANCCPWPQLTLQEERCGGVGLRPGLFGHAVAHRNQDILLRGRDRWVQRSRIWLFGWSFHVRFGTHDSVLVLHSGPLQHKRSEQTWLCRFTRWRFHLLFFFFKSVCWRFLFFFSQKNLQKHLHLHRSNLKLIPSVSSTGSEYICRGIIHWVGMIIMGIVSYCTFQRSQSSNFFILFCLIFMK